MVNVFAVPVFFICFRESLETAIVVAILLALLKQTFVNKADGAVAYKKLRKEVWIGVAAGLVITIIIGAGMIGAFYGLQKLTFNNTEYIWEGTFSLIGCIVITVLGAALLRVNKLREKWTLKITRIIEEREAKKHQNHPLGHRIKIFTERYAMFLLPFVTVLREGLEAVVFIGGVGLSFPAAAFPLPVITGVLAGSAVGMIIYKGGNRSSLQILLIISTCFLYLIAAGLMTRAVASFETDAWNKIVGGDAAEAGTGAGSYDIRKTVWHVNCCSPELSGGWGVFNSLFGWTNTATYGGVISYNVYWIFVIIMFIVLRYRETRGHYPLMKARTHRPSLVKDHESQSSGGDEKATKVDEVKEVKA